MLGRQKLAENDEVHDCVTARVALVTRSSHFQVSGCFVVRALHCGELPVFAGTGVYVDKKQTLSEILGALSKLSRECPQRQRLCKTNITGRSHLFHLLQESCYSIIEFVQKRSLRSDSLDLPEPALVRYVLDIYVSHSPCRSPRAALSLLAPLPPVRPAASLSYRSQQPLQPRSRPRAPRPGQHGPKAFRACLHGDFSTS